MNEVEFTTAVSAPFRLDLTAWALRRRSSNTIDQWTDGRYARLIVHRDCSVRVLVTQPQSAPQELVVTLRSNEQIGERLQADARSLVHKMLGVEVDLTAFYRLAKGDALLGHLVTESAGVRPPRFPSLFESLVNAIACQQVSLDSGIATLNRLSRAFGVALVDEGLTHHAFPRPVDLLDVPVEQIKSVGFSGQKSRAIVGLAELFAEDDTALASLDQLTNDEAVACLSAISGIGRWSSEYVLLRGMGRLDSFPGDDVGAQNNLQELFHRETKPTYDEIKTLVARWSPYQGVVYFHLLLEKLKTKGVL